MLAIGRALMARPKLMLLDEPSLGLAPLLVKEIFAIIRRLRADGMTVLLVEQNAHMALEVADYGYVMELGRIVLGNRLKALARRSDDPGILSRRPVKASKSVNPQGNDATMALMSASQGIVRRRASMDSRRARRRFRRCSGRPLRERGAHPPCGGRGAAYGRP